MTMASLEFDRRRDVYRIRFRFGGRDFKRSLSTSNRRYAEGTLARVRETLMLIESGRLDFPADADPAEFVLSEGKRSEPKTEPRMLTLGELVELYQGQRVPGSKEASTIKTEDQHLRHVLRLMRKATFVRSLRMGDFQAYVCKRLDEKCGSRPIAAETVRKELATLRVVWNWAVRHDYLDRPAPVIGLEYPKRDEKHPFRTWDEIAAILARGGLTAREERELWETLFLTREEVQAALDYAHTAANHAFIHPLLAFVAHTGVRISEALRSRVEDLDFHAGKIIIREKKRSRIRATTFRRVEMTHYLARTLKDWLKVHPGGLHTFCKEEDLNRGRERGGIVPINKHVARKHFLLTFRGSRWAKLRGYHIFRHSFASNLASQGVDQRIIDEWMGHQTEEMRKRYSHLLPDVRRKAIQLLMP